MKYSLMGIKTFTTNITEDPAASFFFSRESLNYSHIKALLSFPYTLFQTKTKGFEQV